MIVECSQCDARFELDEAMVPPDGAWVRCSNCQNVFQAFPPGHEPPVEDDDAGLAMGHQGAGEFDVSLGGDDEDYDLTDADLDAERGAGPGKGFKVFFWLIAIFLLLGVMLVGGLLVMNNLGMYPQLVDKFRGVPGFTVILPRRDAPPAAPGQEAAPAPEKGGMVMAETRSYFKVNERSGKLFVIQGKVINKTSRPLTQVLVESNLYDADGKRARQARVFAGPIFQAEELAQLSITEIQARLASPVGPDGSPYVVQPGQSIPYMVVFADLPKGLTQFTAEAVRSVPYTKPGGSQ